LRFIAIRFYNETGVEAVSADTANVREKRFDFSSDDPTLINRALFDFFKSEGFKVNGTTGRVGVVIFTCSSLRHLTPTFYKYVDPIEGFHNPLILFSSSKGIPRLGDLTEREGVDAIIDLVRKFYQ
jgi:hypothetical protein